MFNMNRELLGYEEMKGEETQFGQMECENPYY